MVRSPSIDKNGIKKGEWSKEEDDKLRAYVNRYGVWNWRQLPKYAGLARCGKSCRLRWKNYLQPNVRRGNFTKEEENIIVNLHNQLGNKWSIIAKNLTGRTDNEIKNYWHTHIKKRTQGAQDLILPSIQVEVESSCQTLQILEVEINQESSQSDNNQMQISTSGLSQGLTSPTISCCSALPQNYCDAPLNQESSANFWNRQLMVENCNLAQGSLSCSESSFSCSDDSNLSNLLTAGDRTTITPTYECFDDFWSQPLFETDCMINSYMHQQPFVDLANPSSPITDEGFLWSYDLSDESIWCNI